MRPHPHFPWPVDLGGCPHCGRFAHVVYAGGCENQGCPGPTPAGRPLVHVTGAA